jgi:methionyl-tRNA synthetase
VASLLWKRFGGRAHPAAWPEAVDERKEAARALEEIGSAIRGAELRRALAGVSAVRAEVNRALASSEPWRLPDDAAHRELTRLLPMLNALGVAAWPIVPGTAERVRTLLGRDAVPLGWALEDPPPKIEQRPEPPLPE